MKKYTFSILAFFISAILLSNIRLPLEVLGSQGVVKKVSFVVEDYSNAKYLWFQVNNLSYDNKASVKINNSDWLDINNESIIIDEKSKAYGGIGGGFSTIEIFIDLQKYHLAKNNTIEFRFNKSDGISIGYRVVQLNVLNKEGIRMISKESISYDNPLNWSIPFPKAEDYAIGEKLWKTASLKDNYLLSSKPIRATCSDCHTQDGRDLKYFNYSNESIVERAKFHGLSELEGQKIASYIRGLKVYQSARARPWNPPYQPGNGTDQRSVKEWAAGSGLSSVLKDDQQMLLHLFKTTKRSDIDQTVDIDQDLNLREMPLSVQFPDWKHWLPKVHPKDIWGEYFDQNEASKSYVSLRKLLDDNSSEELIKKKVLMWEFIKFPKGINAFLNKGATKWANGRHPWIVLEGGSIDQRRKGMTAEKAKYNLALWSSVKQFEIVQEYELEDKIILEKHTSEKYQWPSNQFSTFVIAAHFTGDKRGNSHFAWERPEVGIYFSSIWYQVQMVLTSGMRLGQIVEPVDWAYNYQHILKLGKVTGIWEPLRYFQNLVKGYQQRNSVGKIEPWTWTMREVSPWRLYSSASGDTRLHDFLDTYEPKLRLKLTEAMLNQFLNKVEKYKSMDWPRTDDEGYGFKYWAALENTDYIPKSLSRNKSYLFAPDDSFDAIEADAFYYLIPKFREIGVDKRIIARLSSWCKSIWPNADWKI